MPRGRPRRADPVTADEAVAELWRYDVNAYTLPSGNVGLTVADVNRLLTKLRRRKSPPAPDRK